MARLLSALADLLRGLLGMEGPLRIRGAGAAASRVLEERYRGRGPCC